MEKTPWRERVNQAIFAVIDGGLTGLVAVALSILWVAVRLALDPVPDHIGSDFSVLICSVAVLVMAWIWWPQDGRTWLVSASRRVQGVLVCAVLAGVGVWSAQALSEHAEAAYGGTYLMTYLIGLFIVVWVTVLLLRAVALRRGWVMTWVRGGVALVAVALGFYLIRDEAPAPSIERNRAAMAGRSQDETSYRLTLRYTPVLNGGRVFTPPTRTLKLSNDANWARDLRSQRAAIEANWAELTEVRGWWAELLAQPELGDRVEGGMEQPFIRFHPVRVFIEHALAMAGLQALDGDGDGALARVGEVYAVGARLESASCTLVRGMIAIQCQQRALKAAEFVLTQAKVSPAAAERFAALLATHPGGGAGAKRLVLMEVAHYFGTVECVSLCRPGAVRFAGEATGWRVLRRTLDGVYGLTFNPQETVNLIHDFSAEIAALAEARDLAGMRALEANRNHRLHGGVQIKNISGRLLAGMGISSFDKLVENYWKTEDMRCGLLERLRPAG
jgi:hypothetical protein